jgi:transcriptional repressor NrdR
MVIKRDGRREPFDRYKILNGIQTACAKRPIPTEAIDDTLGSIESELYQRGRREVTSREIGEMVMANLRKLDEVAYIRFATIYRRFADVEDLAGEIENLLERRQKEAAARDQISLEL